MPRRDEEALSWDGDDDPTLDTGTTAAKDAAAEDDAATDDVASDSASLPDGWTPVGRGSGSVTHSAPAAHTPLSLMLLKQRLQFALAIIQYSRNL